MRAHLQDLVNTYGESSLVNLVNHKGHEAPIKQAFERYIQNVSPTLFLEIVAWSHQ